MIEKIDSFESDEQERKLLRIIRLEMIVDKITLARFIPSAYLSELYRYIDETDEVEMRFKINSANTSIFP
jgi:hypothetical protein